MSGGQASAAKSRRVLKVAVGVAASLALAGCASAPSDDTTGELLRTSSPPASASASPAPAPVSRLGLTCSDVLPADLIARAVQEGMVTTELMAHPRSATPLGYAVSQLGGVSCLASVGVSTVEGGSEVGYGAVSVQVLPEAATQWSIFEEQNPAVVSGADAAYGDASTVSCFGRGSESACSVDVLAGDIWIAIVAQGINVAASLTDQAVGEHVAPLITDIVTTVTGALPPAPAWIEPPATASLPSDCTAYATADEFRAMFGTAEEISIGGGNDGDGWGIDNAAWTDVGVHRCMWVPVNTGQTWSLYVTALPGGEWAFDRSAAIMTAKGAVETNSEPIAGIDRATFGCHVYAGFCTLDTVIFGNWVQFNAEKQGIGTADDVRAQLTVMAARAATRFSA